MDKSTNAVAIAVCAAASDCSSKNDATKNSSKRLWQDKMAAVAARLASETEAAQAKAAAAEVAAKAAAARVASHDEFRSFDSRTAEEVDTAFECMIAESSLCEAKRRSLLETFTKDDNSRRRYSMLLEFESYLRPHRLVGQ